MHKIKFDVTLKANNKGFKVKQGTLEKNGIKYDKEAKI